MLTFLSKSIMPDSEKVAHFIVGAADGHHDVAAAGEEGLRRLQNVSLETPEVKPGRVMVESGYA